MRKILLVEDTLVLADEIADLLKFEHFEVQVAHEGNEALETLKQFHPNLIITDLLMPGLDGFELIRNLRTQFEYRSIPIIILSAMDPRDSRILLGREGVNLFLQKPTKMKDLLATINALI